MAVPARPSTPAPLPIGLPPQWDVPHHLPPSRWLSVVTAAAPCRPPPSPPGRPRCLCHHRSPRRSRSLIPTRWRRRRGAAPVATPRTPLRAPRPLPAAGKQETAVAWGWSPPPRPSRQTSAGSHGLVPPLLQTLTLYLTPVQYELPRPPSMMWWLRVHCPRRRGGEHWKRAGLEKVKGRGRGEAGGRAGGGEGAGATSVTDAHSSPNSSHPPTPPSATPISTATATATPSSTDTATSTAVATTATSPTTLLCSPPRPRCCQNGRHRCHRKRAASPPPERGPPWASSARAARPLGPPLVTHPPPGCLPKPLAFSYGLPRVLGAPPRHHHSAAQIPEPPPPSRTPEVGIPQPPHHHRETSMEFGRRALQPAGLCVASIVPPPRSVRPHRPPLQRPRQDASSSPPAFFFILLPPSSRITSPPHPLLSPTSF